MLRPFFKPTSDYARGGLNLHAQEINPFKNQQTSKGDEKPTSQMPMAAQAPNI